MQHLSLKIIRLSNLLSSSHVWVVFPSCLSISHIIKDENERAKDSFISQFSVYSEAPRDL